MKKISALSRETPSPIISSRKKSLGTKQIPLGAQCVSGFTAALPGDSEKPKPPVP